MKINKKKIGVKNDKEKKEKNKINNWFILIFFDIFEKKEIDFIHFLFFYIGFILIYFTY